MIHDRDYDINQDYFEWLCEMIHVDQIDRSYWILMRDLHNKKFVSFIPHDENRAYDGLELRDDYLREIWYSKYEEIEGECSVLEMLIGLESAINASGGNDCAKAAPSSGGIISDGFMFIFAIPRLALNQSPVPLILGKYFVSASLRV